ncbi:GNAT family N-acetyltransferase [Streptomyces sp. SID12501]|uniref:GNAT family N-acetyltransferase n=1 Tax=Streptomyces sp. SID12501 TaxID=2706042 RepID=A0A6B3C860_9ACTN|nr:GNAT family N-acetyltransferase [Streptomyces sp. SID12501]NEC92310.1 GNAT family N-acetyltransferase [Streptomyces sp. SID12501]
MPLIRDISRADYTVVEELLHSNDLGDDRFYNPDGLDVVVAELHGSVVGGAEFHLHHDFGHDEGRETHPGEQTFVLAMAVADTDRRSGVGRALLTEIARRTQEADDTFLALVPQDGDDDEAASRQAFFQACGLTRYGPDRPGAAWGCPVSKILDADAPGSRPFPHQTSPPLMAARARRTRRHATG